MIRSALACAMLREHQAGMGRALDGETIVDARGHRCPTPTLRLRRALAGQPEGAVVVLLADDAMARIDVPHFAAQAGHAVIDFDQDGEVLRFSVRKAASTHGR